MADSIRQQIVDAIETRLKTIIAGHTVQVNGQTYTYQTTLATVTDWPVSALAPADLPAACYFDRDAGINYEYSDLDEIYRDLEVDLEGIVAGSGSREAARKVLQDLESAVNSDLTWGGLAKQTTIEVSEVKCEQAEKLFGGAHLSLRIVHLQ